jgi:hypothetical protein
VDKVAEEAVEDVGRWRRIQWRRRWMEKWKMEVDSEAA